MELAQKYVYTVWKEKSFSKAAKKLYVSQPSLSATVAKLEKELSFQIFDRSTHPVSTTSKGRIYLNFLQEIYDAETQLNTQLAAANDMDQGCLTIGGNITFAQFVFPAVCKMFSKKSPNVSLTLDIESSEEKLRTQLIDLYFTLYPFGDDYVTLPVQQERLFVAIHKDHPSVKDLYDYAITFEDLLAKKIPPQREIADLSVLSNVPFIITSKRSDSDKRISAILKEHLTAQYTVINSRTFDARYRMMQQGLGAILASDFFLKQFPRNQDNMCCFALQSSLSYRTTYLQYRKNSSNQKLLDEFISCVFEYCKSQNAQYLSDKT